MKRKKLLVGVIVILFLAVGWIVSLRSATGAEQKEKQNELVAEAEIYAGKELWVRAIPLYEEALRYNTQENIGIEGKLLAAYLSYGDMDSYNALVEKRASAGTASEEEYITTADSYIAGWNLEEAMALVKKGISQLQSAKLEEYYEDNRYAYTVKMTEYQDILPTGENTLMPAQNEEGWCYVDETGRAQLEGPYETATGFNTAGYGVVSVGGKYYTILENGDKYGVDETGMEDVYGVSGSHILAKADGKYSYYNYDFVCVASSHQYEEITANACGVAAVKKDGKWGIITDSGETVVDFTLEDVAVNSLGEVFSGNSAMVKTSGKWYLIGTEGEKLCETGFTEAKAPESDGYIAVGNGEKWGFIDFEGNLVIDYQYDDALSFSEHLAAVKIGNTWNYISEKNERVIDQEIEDAQPFHNGIAQAQIAGMEALIILEYTEE